jgi:hypothetical protein
MVVMKEKTATVTRMLGSGGVCDMPSTLTMVFLGHRPQSVSSQVPHVKESLIVCSLDDMCKHMVIQSDYWIVSSESNVARTRYEHTANQTERLSDRVE